MVGIQSSPVTTWTLGAQRGGRENWPWEGGKTARRSTKGEVYLAIFAGGGCILGKVASHNARSTSNLVFTLELGVDRALPDSQSCSNSRKKGKTIQRNRKFNSSLTIAKSSYR